MFLAVLVYCVWFQCSTLGRSAMHQLRWQAVDRSTAGPNGFHISRLSPVFWPADRTQSDSPHLVFSVCVACMKPCLVLSWSQVRSRQPRRCSAVEIWYVEITMYSSGETLHPDTLTVSFKSYWKACAVVCPRLLLSNSSAKPSEKYMVVLVVDHICCLDWQKNKQYTVFSKH